MAPALTVNVLISSATFLVAKATVRDFPPLTLVLFRFVLATALLWPLVRVLRRGVRIAPADRGRIWVLGICGVTLNQGLFLVALQWASASHAALLYALTPALVQILAARAGPRPGARQIAGIALAFAGVLLLLLQRGLHFERHSVLGDAVLLVAVLAWSIYLERSRVLIARYGPLVVTAEALLKGTVVYLPVGIIASIGFHPGAVSAGAWSGLFYLAWLTSAINYIIWLWGIEFLGPGTIALFTNLQPVIAAGLARVFLHEALPGGFVLSAALVLGGVWIAQRPPERAPPQGVPATDPAPP
jgi:drug/metabolite transporter (DMT)-like permease